MTNSDNTPIEISSDDSDDDDVQVVSYHTVSSFGSSTNQNSFSHIPYNPHSFFQRDFPVLSNWLDSDEEEFDDDEGTFGDNSGDDTNSYIGNLATRLADGLNLFSTSLGGSLLPAMSLFHHSQPRPTGRSVEEIPDWMKPPQKKDKTPSNPQAKTLKCGICWDEESDVVSTSCGHIFCRTCMIEMFNKKSDVQCPYCRTQLTKKDVHRLFLDN